MNRVSRRGLRPPAMLARFIDEPLLQVIGATPTRAAIERADFGEASEDHLSILRADAFARAQEPGLFGQNGVAGDEGVAGALDGVDLAVEDLDHRFDRGLDAGLVGLMGAAAFGLTRGRSRRRIVTRRGPTYRSRSRPQRQDDGSRLLANWCSIQNRSRRPARHSYRRPKPAKEQPVNTYNRGERSAPLRLLDRRIALTRSSR